MTKPSDLKQRHRSPAFLAITLPLPTHTMDQGVNEALKDGLMVPTLSRIDSVSEADEYDDVLSDEDIEDTGYKLKSTRLSTDLEHAYDLKPPPPTNTDRRAETIAERLFSVEHLYVILRDTAQLQRFTTFLMRYRAKCVPTLVRYLDSQKALMAIQYANALADQITQQPSWPSKATAATLDPQFEQLSQRTLDELVAEALPAYITFTIVDVVTELLNKEIVGKNTPVMRELVHGLAEVYCLSDPTQEGNPIVFASDGEFDQENQPSQLDARTDSISQNSTIQLSMAVVLPSAKPVAFFMGRRRTSVLLIGWMRPSSSRERLSRL